ncbi:MAG: hypothetical protein WAK54_31925, partial [Bradyrhizobium sp.]
MKTSADRPQMLLRQLAGHLHLGYRERHHCRMESAVNPTNAVIIVDNSNGGRNGAVYKELAFGTNIHGNFQFATNFRAGTVEVYDVNFKLTALDGAFSDPQIPAGFAPFGIANVDGDLFVT